MEDMSKQLRDGMEVYTADGRKLGKINHVWYGTSVGGPVTTEEETCVELHRGLLGRETVYLPCRIISAVDATGAKLSVDEQTVKETPSWHRKPAWIS
jgi:hypothetical protein